MAITLAFGIPTGWGLSRLISKLLAGIAVLDPLRLAAATATVAATLMLATWLPARRATRVDPLMAIRHQ